MIVKILIFFSSLLIISVLIFFFLQKPKNILLPKFTVNCSHISVPSCPDGYILVLGNSDYKTSDFCVMKYDAKCSNPDLKCITNEGVYKNDAPGCACSGTFQVVSKADGAPITFIPEDGSETASAKVYCSDIGSHLITNDEWMTIARNVEKVNANWCNADGTGCGNPPGTAGKILANGHNNCHPNKALPAGPDSQPNYLSDQKRTLELSNGQIIWDFAGNVWQWVDATVARKDEPRTTIPGYGNSRWTWGEFQTVPYSNDFDPSNPNWSSKQGVGRIYHFNSLGDTDTTLYTYIRGGNWRHGEDSGAFTIHMQPTPGKTGIDDIGFRCVTEPK